MLSGSIKEVIDVRYIEDLMSGSVLETTLKPSISLAPLLRKVWMGRSGGKKLNWRLLQGRTWDAVPGFSGV
jgi:protein gp37